MRLHALQQQPRQQQPPTPQRLQRWRRSGATVRPHTSRRLGPLPASASFPSPSTSAPPAVGIDLGTTSSAVAVIGSDGRAYLVEDELGLAVIPSVVHVTQDGSVLVGQAAVAAAASDPCSTFFSVKRIIGRTFAQVQHLLPGLTYKVMEGPGGSALLACGPQALTNTPEPQPQPQPQPQQPDPLSPSPAPALPRGSALLPEQVSAHLLRHLLDRAQRYAGGTAAVREAVVTVPAYFNAQQRRATVRAAQLAGLEKVTLLQEPVAAAMAYGFGKPSDWDTLLVFDLGGGTLDLSLLEAFEGIMEVVATGGDAHLGGDDFTDAVGAALSLELPREGGGQLEVDRQRPSFRLALRRAAEAAKEALSSSEQVEVPLQLPGPSATPSATPAAPSATPSATLRLSRSSMEAACAGLLVRLWAPLEDMVRGTRTQLAGSSPLLLPAWQQQQQQQQQLPQQQQPEPAPSAAPKVWGREFEVFASSSSNGGGGGGGGGVRYAAPPRRLTGVVLVGAATRMPVVRSFIRHVTGLDPAAGVDPEAVVALGAAIHAGVLQGSSSGVELTDGSYVAELHNRASALLSDWQA